MPDIFVASTNKALQPGHIGMFSSFSENPSEIHFQTQEPDEVILLFLRRHFITNVPWILLSIALAFLPLLFFALKNQIFINVLDIPSRFILVFTLFYYLILLSFVFINFLDWFYNVFMVTNKRVVDIDYSNVVVHNVAVTKLSHLQDVSYTQSGFIRAIFNYGDIFVQTAGTEVNFEALKVPRPREATHIIGDLIGKAHHGT